MDLETYAANCARAEAGQPLRFPESKITPIPHDPLAHADGAIQQATEELQFAVIEAFAANDATGMAQLVAHIQKRADALLVLETMSKDLQSRIKEPK